MEFCRILRELLEDNDITQKKLADDLNIGVTTIGNYIRGIREPDFETLKLISAYFNVTTDYLLDVRSTNTSDHNEDELLRIYRALPKDQQKLLLEQSKVILRFNLKRK